MPKIKTILCEVATDVEADRALLFEYSDGVSNLVGLPFLYMTATLEVIKPGITSVINNYQKTNVLIVSDFIEQLEINGYMYFKELEDIKEKYPIVYGFMHPNGPKSGLFYSIYDKETAIGFVVVTTVKETFERHDVLPRVAASAQRISALLNYDKIKSELE